MSDPNPYIELTIRCAGPGCDKVKGVVNRITQN